MSRTARVNRGTALVLALVWLAGFVLTLRAELSGVLTYPAHVFEAAAGPTDYPRVSWVWPEFRDRPDGVRPGDRLLSVAGHDLAGAGKLETLLRVLAESRSFEVPVRVERAAASRPAVISVLPVDYGFAAGLSSTLYMLVAFVLLWRVPSRGARNLGWSFFAFACGNLNPWGGNLAGTAFGVGLHVAGICLFAPLGIRALQTFPEATARTGRWAPFWPWLFLVYGALYSGQFLDWPVTVPFQHPIVLAVQGATALVFLVMIINNYRNSPPRERRQLAWVLLGVWLAMLPVILGTMVQAAIGHVQWIYYGMGLASAILPVSVLIALTWYNLGDVNRLVSRAAAYGLLGIVFVGAIYLVVPTAANAFSTTTGAEPATIQALLSFVLTVLVVVAAARLPNLLERRLFPERFALESSMGAVLENLSASRSPRELAERLSEELSELLVPEGLAVLLRTGDALTPVAGTHTGAVLPLDDPTVRRIFRNEAPLAGPALQRALGREREALLSGLDARVLVPVRRGGDATALVALGAKGSGDVYTASDLAHLATVGARVALELQRYETDEIVRSGREMVDEIRLEKQAAEIESRAKTRFLAAASHDLRQPLHALGLYVETLRERVGDSEHADLVRQIDRSTATLGETIDDLLDVSKLDAGAMEAHPVDMDLAPLLERHLEQVAPLAAEKALQLRWVPTTLRVRSDPVLLGRIVQNLLSNAVRYTERGRVLVGCRRRGLDVSIEVWDTGPGIPEEDRERIFAEFTRGRSPGAAGTGLGLAIVRGMGELLEHPVSFDSEVGRGTVFRVRVPRARARARPEAGAQQVMVAGQLSGTIALLEDDEAVRAGTVGLLERWGAAVVAAASLDELLTRLEGAPDVIVADYDLGGGPNGLEAISQLRAQFGEAIPAMIVTGTAAPDLPERCAEHGLPLLSKPLRPAQLRAALSRLRSPSGSRA